MTPGGVSSSETTATTVTCDAGDPIGRGRARPLGTGTPRTRTPVDSARRSPTRLRRRDDHRACPPTPATVVLREQRANAGSWRWPITSRRLTDLARVRHLLASAAVVRASGSAREGDL